MSDPIHKIIFLLDQPFNTRLYEILGVEILAHNGFEVEIWDVTPYFHPAALEKMVIDTEDVYKICKKFDKKRDILLSILEISPDTIVNSFIPFQCQTYFIYRLLSKKNIRYSVAQMISFPSPPSPQIGAPVEMIRSLLKKATALKLEHAILGLCDNLLSKYFFLFGIRPADIVLRTGERSSDIMRDPIDAKTHIVWGHAWDYDIYLKERDREITPDPNLGIFLDEFFPLHTDLEYLGISSPIEAEEYYANLCSFFDHLEKIYNVRIVIAAHPRSDYSKTTHYFGGRPVIKGQTARLVHESAFVLAHDSTSINFAVLFRKPVIFITMDKMQKCDAGKLNTGVVIESIAHSLNKASINIDSPFNFDWTEELKVDIKSYKNYQNDYIKFAGSPEIPFWEIYLKSLRKMCQ